MSWQTTSPAYSIRNAVRHVSLDSNLTAKDFLSLALVTAVTLLIVASDMITVFKESLEFNTPRFRQVQLNDKVLQVRILNVAAQHLITFCLRRRLPNHLHFFNELEILPLKRSEGNLLVREGFPAFKDGIKVDFFVWTI